MKKIYFVIFLFIAEKTLGQELYVFTEPASNMPAYSISGKITSHLIGKDNIYGRFTQRYMPEIMFGISKKFMLHVSTTFSNMHTANTRFESIAVYGKFRFLSHDDIHKHFRMALFTEISHTRSPFHYDEISLMGDKGGVQVGIIATQLWNKFALSGTISHTEVLDKSRFDKVFYFPPRSYQSMDYSLSAGYLLLPREYTDYKQLNINIYMELLAQHTLDQGKNYVDLAPAVQFIFNSNAKLNVGYRFQLSSNMLRMANNSWLISFERTFLNSLKHRRNK